MTNSNRKRDINRILNRVYGDCILICQSRLAKALEIRDIRTFSAEFRGVPYVRIGNQKKYYKEDILNFLMQKEQIT